MKQYKYLISGILASAFITTGCSDAFLEVESPVNETIESYFTTEEHLKEAVVAAYDPLHWTDWSNNEYNPINIMSDIMADDIWVGGQDKTDNKNWHLMMNYEALPTAVITSLWIDAYTGVKRSNDILRYISWTEGLSESKKNYYTAEAITLRVFYYNWLWKFWGNIPYYTENLNPPFIAEQLKADDIYKNIITDLESVIDMNVLPMKESSDNLGKVTQAMAYMLYAEIVMYQNDESRYSKALGYMQEIIANPEYDLVDDFASIFMESGEWCEESIFEINYKDDNAVRSWSAPLAAGGSVLPTLVSPHSWPDGTEGHDQGWGFCPVRQETYDMFADNDMRRDATCFNTGNVEYLKRYQDTGFFLQKYAALSGNNKDQKADAQLNWNNNLRIYRYSETLLNAAELLVRTNGNLTEAKIYLNDVRKRAGLQTEIEPTIDNIINERRLEFVGEGKRYWDLIRTGKASTVLVPDSYGYRTNAWTENKKYLPIPQSEIDASQNTLTQNNY